MLLIVTNQNHRLILLIAFFEVKKQYRKNESSPILQEIPFLAIDTFKSCCLTNGSRRCLSKGFRTITWLRWFLCQWTHEWWVENNRSV